VYFPKTPKKKRGSIEGVNNVRRGSLIPTTPISRSLRRGSLAPISPGPRERDNEGRNDIFTEKAVFTRTEKLHNAEYMLSLAQTLGAKMFCFPEDIVAGNGLSLSLSLSLF
jgi:hypothetical protein